MNVFRSVASPSADHGNFSGLVLAEFETTRVDELMPMWRKSFEFGVGMVDTHPLQEQFVYFW